jgi:cutinase
MGQPFVDDLRADIGPRTVGVYAVNYPAITDWSTTPEGADDAVARVREMMANCPATKLVLGGYSQGAAVVSMATDGRLPPDALGHIAALALFGMPSVEYVNSHGSPAIGVGQSYLAKTINLCVPEDPVCTPGGFDGMAHGSYATNGMVAQAADFAAQQVG